MTRLSDVSPGDMITSSRQNIINDYINDGTEYVNTASLKINGDEVISSQRYVKPVRIVNTGAGGLDFYASDGITLLANLDENGNLSILGRFLQL